MDRYNKSTPATAFINARIIDPSQSIDAIGTLFVKAGVIEGIELGKPDIDSAEWQIENCQNLVLCTGLVDMQVRTGEPGNEHEETLESASHAAIAGGVTTIVTMPDTDPTIDDMALVEFINRTARETAACRIHVMGGLTKGLKGIEMAELRLMRDVGAVAFTNGGTSVANASIMRRALSYTKDFNALIVHHVEDADLAANGVMNEGELATRLGLRGNPKMAEIIMLERDIRLAELTGGAYHAASISCSESAQIVAKAKARGLNVTCGASINNLTLNENDIGSYRSFFKLSPPLRTEEDRLALVDALANGIIDVVHSDHTPRDVDDKRHPFADAADGAVGLESLLAAGLRLVHEQQVTLPDLIAAMSTNPAKRLDLPSGTLQKGKPADLALIDIDMPWIAEEKLLRSRSKNSAFESARFTGKVTAVYIGGHKAALV